MEKIANTNSKETNNKILRKTIINSVLILVFGILLGVLSKWLDNLEINDSIWWQSIIGRLDLRNFFSSIGIWILIAFAISVYSKSPIQASINVFLFFIGMTVSYHIYTVLFSGFNPRKYMMIWYCLAIISPLFAYICWYGRSNKNIKIAINGFVLSIMILSCFSIGMWYFDIKSILDTLTFVAMLIIINTKLRNTIISLLIGICLAFCIKILLFG